MSVIHIRLRDYKDDDIKEWYKNLPKGSKAHIVRQILKEHITGSSKPKIETNIDMDLGDVEFESEEREVKDEEIEDNINNLIDSFK